MKSSTRPKKAFTFLELLFALFCFGLIQYSIQTLVVTFGSYENRIHRSSYLDFCQFMVVLDKELSKLRVTGHSSQILYLEDPTSHETYRLICQNHKIYKADGHHPLLYGVQAWQLSVEGDILHLLVKMEDQAVYQGSVIIYVK